jgi:preprotein translocase subunit SecA
LINLILRKIFGTRNERLIKKLWPIVRKTNEFGPKMSSLSDKELREMTDKFRERIKAGETFDDLLVESFAVVREAAVRVFNNPEIVTKLFGDPKLKRYHKSAFDVQLIGGIVLHQGKIAEMATGEGKTLVALFPAYLNALSGKGVHIVTTNEFLAGRDASWMGEVFKFLGLTVGVTERDMTPEEKKAAYNCDIIYGRNDEFGFDFLRDNMVVKNENKVQRNLHYAIVDEVDSILVDEARTPLIISGLPEKSSDKYYKIDRIVPRLEKQVDFEIDEKAHTVTLTESGGNKSEKLLNIKNLFEPKNLDIVHHINQALRAHHLYKKDDDYVVKDGKIIIVDEFTGRLMPGRRWSDGLHQAVEAKEKVSIEMENQTMATVTYQNYFRMYEKLAGMTGTAATEATEFDQIYKLDVVVIPTNMPLIRTEYKDVIYKTINEKFNAVGDEIEELHSQGRPVLVGTISIDKSERLSRMLKKRNIPHSVLNAKYHEKESEIIARAGQEKTVTIATNMAGRGVDIVLGPGVAEKGGLHIIGTERHEARRIDNQLRGRAGRQGDPGSSRFYLSLEDDLMRIFASDRIARVMEWLKWEKGVPLQHKFLNKTIERAQKRVEAHNFDIRKQLLEYDNVMSKQREAIYEQRDMVLYEKDITSHFKNMIDEFIEKRIAIFANKDLKIENWDIEGIMNWAKRSFNIDFGDRHIEQSPEGLDKLEEFIKDDALKAYKQREEHFGKDLMRDMQRFILLQLVDNKWKDHLASMDHLREGIHYRAYAQKDPLVEYQNEGYEMFINMMDAISEEAVEFIFKAQPVRDEDLSLSSLKSSDTDFDLSHPEIEGLSSRMKMEEQGGEESSQPRPVSQQDAEEPVTVNIPYKRQSEKVGRNAPCPCGSGKKYKKCCGK